MGTEGASGITGSLLQCTPGFVDPRQGVRFYFGWDFPRTTGPIIVNGGDYVLSIAGLKEMRITGPERYKLTFDANAFVVTSAKGTPNFSGIATSKKPKLYIASVDDKPIYVGVTKQSIRNRLRFGWNAEGKGGYYGYAWRHAHGVVAVGGPGV